MTGNIFYTADPHVGGHQLVAELRGFATPAEHDAALAHLWDTTVRPTEDAALEAIIDTFPNEINVLALRPIAGNVAISI